MSRRRTSSAETSAAAIAAALLLAGSIVAVDRSGRSRRSPGPAGSTAPGIFVATDSAATAEQWRASGLRGQELVYASRFLHFVAPSETLETPPLEEFPYRNRLDGSAPVDHRNLLWTAVRRNVARRVTHLVPSSVLREKAGEGAAVERIRTQEFGTPRAIDDRLPGSRERPPLGIDAALFTADDGPELAERLLAESGRFSSVVFNLAEDNPAVDDAARSALRELAARWPGSGRVGD